jgi:hypothetical protein
MIIFMKSYKKSNKKRVINGHCPHITRRENIKRVNINVYQIFMVQDRRSLVSYEYNIFEILHHIPPRSTQSNQLGCPHVAHII